MAVTFIRGSGVKWIRFCDECKKMYFKQVSKKKPECELCGQTIEDGLIGVRFCSGCSSETGMCQCCGTNIGVEKKPKKTKKAKKKKEEKPMSGDTEKLPEGTPEDPTGEVQNQEDPDDGE